MPKNAIPASYYYVESDIVCEVYIYRIYRLHEMVSSLVRQETHTYVGVHRIQGIQGMEDLHAQLPPVCSFTVTFRVPSELLPSNVEGQKGYFAAKTFPPSVDHLY